MSLKFALLGLLADQPASGYDLTRRFEQAMRRYAWHAQHSQIYPELSRLRGDGLVKVVEEGARRRRTYAITATGRAQLRNWLLNPPADFEVRNELVLRLFLISTLTPDDARAILRPLAEQSARELQRLRASIANAATAGQAAAPLPFGRLAAEFGLRSFKTLHDWALWALAEIDRGDSSPRGSARR